MTLDLLALWEQSLLANEAPLIYCLAQVI